MSLAKQNFSTSSEEAINQQINTELQASQVYLSMAAWAQHTTVALPGKSVSDRMSEDPQDPIRSSHVKCHFTRS